MRLTSFSPTSVYPSLDLYRHLCLARAVYNGVHPVNHRLLQPALGLFSSILVALDDHLVVAHQDWHGSQKLASTLPQESQRKLQTIGSGTLNRSVEAVRQPLDVHAASAN
jgi:hypothetical protein